MTDLETDYIEAEDALTEHRLRCNVRRCETCAELDHATEDAWEAYQVAEAMCR